MHFQLTCWVSTKHELSYAGQNLRLVDLIQLQKLSIGHTENTITNLLIGFLRVWNEELVPRNRDLEGELALLKASSTHTLLLTALFYQTGQIVAACVFDFPSFNKVTLYWGFGNCLQGIRYTTLRASTMEA
jgi:hypothetical protein